MPDWKRYLRETLSLPVMKGHREERMIEELAGHLEDLYREALARGVAPEEAEERVRRWLGDPARAAEELTRVEPSHVRAEVDRWLESREDGLRRRGGPLTVISDAIRDLRLGLRGLARRPGFTSVVILVLALGIGATTAIFTLVDAVVISPLPFQDPGRLVSVHHRAPAWGLDDAGQCAAWHYTYEDESRVFQDLGMYGGGRSLLTGDGPPQAAQALRVTEGVLPALGLRPLAGRVFTAVDMDPDGAPTVMLAEGYWRSRFGADPSVVGRTLQVDGEAREIIGVAPRELNTLADAAPDLITPLRFRRSTLFVGNIGFGAVGRLKDGVTVDQAAADLNRVLPLAWEKFPGGPVASSGGPSDFRAEVRPLKEEVVGSVAELLWILMGGVGVVLLIACANVANLVLMRADARQAEMSLRSTMGASGRRIGWEYLKESLLLTAGGGALGLLLALLGLRALLAATPTDIPRLGEVGLDAEVLLFTVGVSVAAGFLFGLAPAVRHGRANVMEALKGAGRGGGADRRRRRLRDLSAVAQMALALVLIVASGLLFRTFKALGRVDPGFGDPRDVLVARLYIPPQEVRDPAEVASTYETIVRRVGEIPGVTSVAYATAVPMDGTSNFNPLYVRGRTGGAGAAQDRRHKWIGGSYFETLRIPVLAGRAITWDDVHARAPVAMLSERLARELFGSPEAALGQFVAARPDPPIWKEVVGVARDVREYGPMRDPPFLVYWPQVTLAFWEGAAEDDVETWRDAGLAIRGPAVERPGFREALEGAIWEINPNLPLLRVRSLPDLMAGYAEQTSFMMTLMGLAGGIALVLGLVGVYGVIAYGVTRRTHELGMRMALGASRERVLGMVLRQGAVLAAAGVVVGLALAWGTTRFMASALFGVRPVDPTTYGLVAAGLMAIALLASWLPARRAAGVDPVEALREE